MINKEVKGSHSPRPLPFSAFSKGCHASSGMSRDSPTKLGPWVVQPVDELVFLSAASLIGDAIQETDPECLVSLYLDPILLIPIFSHGLCWRLCSQRPHPIWPSDGPACDFNCCLGASLGGNVNHDGGVAAEGAAWWE